MATKRKGLETLHLAAEGKAKAAGGSPDRAGQPQV